MSVLVALASRLGLKAWGAIAAGLAVLALLATVYGKGRAAERLAQASLNAKVKDDQLKAAARRPRTRRDLTGSMRDGTF